MFVGVDILNEFETDEGEAEAADLGEQSVQLPATQARSLEGFGPGACGRVGGAAARWVGGACQRVQVFTTSMDALRVTRWLAGGFSPSMVQPSRAPKASWKQGSIGRSRFGNCLYCPSK